MQKSNMEYKGYSIDTNGDWWIPNNMQSLSHETDTSNVGPGESVVGGSLDNSSMFGAQSVKTGGYTGKEDSSGLLIVNATKTTISGEGVKLVITGDHSIKRGKIEGNCLVRFNNDALRQLDVGETLNISTLDSNLSKALNGGQQMAGKVLQGSGFTHPLAASERGVQNQGYRLDPI